jgi:hypothetical protein
MVLAGVLTAIIAIVAVVAIVCVLFGGSSYRPVQMSDAFIGLEDEISSQEDTARLCAEVECVEGWRTDVGRYLRFGTDDAAEYWGLVVGGEVYRNGTVLLDLNGYELSTSDRELAVQMLFPGRDWNMTPWLG